MIFQVFAIASDEAMFSKFQVEADKTVLILKKFDEPRAVMEGIVLKKKYVIYEIGSDRAIDARHTMFRIYMISVEKYNL